MGLGANAKRFFKVRRLVSVTAPVNLPQWTQISDNPSLSQDWVPISNLFQMYRVNGIRITWIPRYNSRDFAASAAYVWRPVYVVHDTNNSITAIPSEDDVLQYENLRIKSMNDMWSTYYKMSRRLNPTASQTLSTDGYSSVGNPQATQQLAVLFPNIGASTATIIGTIVITQYLTAKARS